MLERQISVVWRNVLRGLTGETLCPANKIRNNLAVSVPIRGHSDQVGFGLDWQLWKTMNRSTLNRFVAPAQYGKLQRYSFRSWPLACNKNDVSTCAALFWFRPPILNHPFIQRESSLSACSSVDWNRDTRTRWTRNRHRRLRHLMPPTVRQHPSRHRSRHNSCHGNRARLLMIVLGLRLFGREPGD